MKKTIKKVSYDTDRDTSKCKYRHGTPVGSIVETAYLTQSGHWYLCQEVQGEPAEIIPMTVEDMARWSTSDSKKAFKKTNL